MILPHAHPSLILFGRRKTWESMSDKSLKVLWNSNAPWSSTGYGNQTAIFAPRIKQLGHEISISATYGLEGGCLNWNGVPVFPRAYHAYGQDIAPAHAMTIQADILITLLDAWVYDANAFAGQKWVPWFPVDMDPLPPPVKKAIAPAFARIVYSKFAQKSVQMQGLDCLYVPHGVETDVYKPVDRIEAREKTNLPKDAFIVGMVAANKGMPSRKAFAQNIEAFAMLKRKRPDAIMYIHTDAGMGPQSFNINEYVVYMGLRPGVDVLLPDPYQYHVGFPSDFMNLLYNAFDVHQLVSMGEGFGIPIVEAQSAGCPVLVGDWTAMSELCFSGWKVDIKDAKKVWTPLAAYQFDPDPVAIYEQLELAYRVKDNTEYRERARKGARAYDADRVTEKYWKPALESLYKRIKEPDVEIVQDIKFVE